MSKESLTEEFPLVADDAVSLSVAQNVGDRLNSSALPPTLTLDLWEEEMGAGAIIRPERNLEKWPIWEPSNARHQMQARTLQREIRLPDGGVAVARVEVGFTNNGALTTDDQKTWYALFKLWAEQERPNGRLYFSRQQLARVLGKSWGSKTNKAITDSLLRLRFTPFVWERSYFDSARQETVERIDTFNILSELHLVRRTKGEAVLAEGSYLEFNERILANLKENFTRPVYLETILRFKSEIAQILYTYLDLVMSDKTRYERRTKELFAELGIDGETYRYASKREHILRRALEELVDVPVPTGTITVSLQRTVDNLDWKIVAQKTRRTGSHRKNENRETPRALPQPSLPEMSAPVVTKVVNAPLKPNKRRGRPLSRPELPSEATVNPVETFFGSEAVNTSSNAVEASQRANSGQETSGENPYEGENPKIIGRPIIFADRTLQTPDEAILAQVRHFYQVFFQTGDSARPTAKEKALAVEHLERLGPDKAQYLVLFARREAAKTKFAIQNYAGIAQYEGRATAEYEANERSRHDALTQRAKDAHRQQRFPAYLEFLRQRLNEGDAAPTPDFMPFLEEERQGRERLTEGKIADSPVTRRVRQSYDEPEARLSRFRDFLGEQMKQGRRVRGALSFWEWDAQISPEPFEEKFPVGKRR